MNVLVLVQFCILLVFCAVLAGLDQWWLVGHDATRVWYLESLNQYPDLPPGGLGWFISVRSLLRSNLPARARARACVGSWSALHVLQGAPTPAFAPFPSSLHVTHTPTTAHTHTHHFSALPDTDTD